MSTGTAVLLDDRRARYLVRDAFTSPGLATRQGLHAVGEGSWGETLPWQQRSLAAPRLDFRKAFVWDVGSATSLPATVAVAVFEDSAPEHKTDLVIGVRSIVKEVAAGIERLLAVARDETFQDGLESNLSVGLMALLRRFPTETMAVVSELIVARSVSNPIICELLYTLGRAESPTTTDNRFALLVALLRDKLPLIRDAAGTALAYMDDARAIPYLKKAIDSETVVPLRLDLQAVVDQLAG